MGAESKLKAGEAGDKEGKPPPADSGTARSAGNQPSKPPPPEPVFHKKSLCRPGSARGCKGRSPLHKITLVSPFPGGEGGRGDGGRIEAKGKGSRRQRRQAPRQQLNVKR